MSISSLKTKWSRWKTSKGQTMANLSQKIKELEEQAKSVHDTNLSLEAYLRRENIKFMNIQETDKKRGGSEGRYRGNTPSLLRTRTWL